MDHFMKHYTVKMHADGYSFLFYCDLCNKRYETDIIKTTILRDALMTAQKTARQYFNKCHCCGKWICDEHYNEAVMQCVECAPLQQKKGSRKERRRRKG